MLHLLIWKKVYGNIRREVMQDVLQMYVTGGKLLKNVKVFYRNANEGVTVKA